MIWLKWVENMIFFRYLKYTCTTPYINLPVLNTCQFETWKIRRRLFELDYFHLLAAPFSLRRLSNTRIFFFFFIGASYCRVPSVSCVSHISSHSGALINLSIMIAVSFRTDRRSLEMFQPTLFFQASACCDSPMLLSVIIFVVVYFSALRWCFANFEGCPFRRQLVGIFYFFRLKP